MRAMLDSLVAFVMTEMVVLGCDPEYADFSNPRGERFGFAAVVVLEAPDGRRWAHFHTFRSRHEAEAREAAAGLLARVEAALDAGTLRRLDDRFWVEARPCYGSVAYVDGGHEAAAAEAERSAMV